MREVIKKVYKFNELNPEAQSRAIKNYIESIDWSIESEHISDSFKEVLRNLGYPSDDVSWSLGYSQGDGVAFYGLVDIETVSRRLLSESEADFLIDLLDEIDLEIRITRNSFGYHYSHWNTMSASMTLGSFSDRLAFNGEYEGEDVDVELSEKVESIACDMRDLISNEIKSVSRELETDGYESIRYIEDEENAREYLSIECDYEYYEDGNTFGSQFL